METPIIKTGVLNNVGGGDGPLYAGEAPAADDTAILVTDSIRCKHQVISRTTFRLSGTCGDRRYNKYGTCLRVRKINGRAETHLDQLDSIDVTERYCHLACASDTFRFERALDISILSADVHGVGRQINYIHMDSSPGFCPSKIKFCSGPSRNNPSQSSLFAKWGSYARKFLAQVSHFGQSWY